jgi:hypothetical protein
MITHHPVRGTVYITQPFGPANWNAVYSHHNGVDFGGRFDVIAAGRGTVVHSGYDPNPDPKWKGGYGLYVIIQHENDLKTLYAHLEYASVKIGDVVIGGECIGKSDSTGYSTGHHLHFGVKLGDEWVDPQPYLDALCDIADADPVELEQGDVLTVVGSLVNFRKDTGIADNLLATVFRGAVVTVEGEVIKDNGLEWVPISITGYMARRDRGGLPLLE